MNLDKATVEKLAHLARLEFSEKEKEEMQKEEVFPEGTTFEDIKPYVSMYKDHRNQGRSPEKCPGQRHRLFQGAQGAKEGEVGLSIVLQPEGGKQSGV